MAVGKGGLMPWWRVVRGMYHRRLSLRRGAGGAGRLSILSLFEMQAVAC